MRRLAAWIAPLVFIVATAAFADDAAAPDAQVRHDLAQQIVALTTGGQIIQTMLDAIWPLEEQTFRKANPGIAQEALDSLKATFADALHGLVGDLSAPVADSYAEQFTADDLKALLAFYQSPTGSKFLSVTPSIMKQIMPTLMQREQELLPKIMQQLIQAAKAKGLNVVS